MSRPFHHAPARLRANPAHAVFETAAILAGSLTSISGISCMENLISAQVLSDRQTRRLFRPDDPNDPIPNILIVE